MLGAAQFSGKTGWAFAFEIQILQRPEMIPSWEYGKYQLLSKAYKCGVRFLPWVIGNLNLNISDSSKLYFLLIIKRGQRNIFFSVICVLGMMLCALTYINLFKLHSFIKLKRLCFNIFTLCYHSSKINLSKPVTCFMYFYFFYFLAKSIIIYVTEFRNVIQLACFM